MACSTCGSFNPVISSCCHRSGEAPDTPVLRSNYNQQEPSASLLVHTAVDCAKSTLTSVSPDIVRIQTILQHLSLKNKLNQCDISSHESLSPVESLPNELLSEIFLSCCSASTPTPFLDLHDDALWSMLQVCSLWRNTALSTPRLWNTLLIDLTHLKGKPINYTRLLTRLQTCLAHSGALPLNFALTGTHFEDSNYLIPLITTLCTHAHKWSKVYFCPYATNILAAWLPSFRHLSTPLLTSLSLTSFNPFPGFIQTPTRFTATPSLTRLALYDYRTRPNTDPTLLPPFHSQITHLYLDSCPYYTYADILPHLPSLTYLEILNKYQHTARVPDTTPLHLPNLRTFKATGWLGNLCFLLPHLDLPLIQRIDIMALEEQCHPCTCAVVKRRIINEWVESLRKDVRVTVDHIPTLDLNVPTATDDGIIRFLFSDLDHGFQDAVG